MILVIDTNIIISALIKPFSDSSKILNLILSGKIKLAYDSRILYEYEEILRRKKFNFDPQNTEAIITQIKEEGIHIDSLPLNVAFPDKDDAPFLEVAVSARVDVIVTGNKKHFPKTHSKNIEILSPSEFLKAFKDSID
ncbi:MAG: putative toxin-antitoxin system toxin component, PIN family [Actinobacteria bacterium]|nr:putative toxin-antitoxin system toxin component, PIN family [Actinomycetota bacterium]MCG2788712.1 putative toxin-antitoxin system toxin component, PIN family [Actinomycetes bacterium]